MRQAVLVRGLVPCLAAWLCAAASSEARYHGNGRGRFLPYYLGRVGQDVVGSLSLGNAPVLVRGGHGGIAPSLPLPRRDTVSMAIEDVDDADDPSAVVDSPAAFSAGAPAVAAAPSGAPDFEAPAGSPDAAGSPDGAAEEETPLREALATDWSRGSLDPTVLLQRTLGVLRAQIGNTEVALTDALDRCGHGHYTKEGPRVSQRLEDVCSNSQEVMMLRGKLHRLEVALNRLSVMQAEADDIKTAYTIAEAERTNATVALTAANEDMQERAAAIEKVEHQEAGYASLDSKVEVYRQKWIHELQGESKTARQWGARRNELVRLSVSMASQLRGAVGSMEEGDLHAKERSEETARDLAEARAANARATEMMKRAQELTAQREALENNSAVSAQVKTEKDAPQAKAPVPPRSLLRGDTRSRQDRAQAPPALAASEADALAAPAPEADAAPPVEADRPQEAPEDGDSIAVITGSPTAGGPEPMAGAAKRSAGGFPAMEDASPSSQQAHQEEDQPRKASGRGAPPAAEASANYLSNGEDLAALSAAAADGGGSEGEQGSPAAAADSPDPLPVDGGDPFGIASDTDLGAP